MKAKEKLPVKAVVNGILKDKHGNIKSTGLHINTITNLHDALIADLMAGGSDTLIGYGHAGTGDSQTAADTNLDAPFEENRTALDSSTQQAGADDNDVEYVYTLAAGVCTGNITELGLFTSQTYSEGNMMCYTDTDVNYSKGADDTLEVTWTVTYGSS